MRVAEVWMDDWKYIFYKTTPRAFIPFPEELEICALLYVFSLPVKYIFLSFLSIQKRNNFVILWT